MATPNMNLTLPVVSTTPGPLWATEVNNSFNTIDQHNHTFGNGALVPTAGLDINADLEFNGYAALGLTGVSFSGFAFTPVRGIYANVVGDLYYNNASGVSIPITSGPTLAATSLGGITGLATTNGKVVFDPGTGIFTFTQDNTNNTPGGINCGPLIVRRASSNSFGVEILPASGIGANYTLELPTALPVSNSYLTVNTGGSVVYKSLSTNQQLLSTSTGSTSFSTYTALLATVTITTTGNPVIIGITPDATGSDGSISLTPASSGGRMKAWLRTVVDGSINVGTQVIELEAPAAGFLQLPLGCYSAFYPVAAGTHTFRLYGKTQPSGGGYVTTTVGIQNGKFFVYEL